MVNQQLSIPCSIPVSIPVQPWSSFQTHTATPALLPVYWLTWANGVCVCERESVCSSSGSSMLLLHFPPLFTAWLTCFV